MPGYTREQLDTIRRLKSTPGYRNASPRERKASIETILVESNARDVGHGDRDSEGAFQQRPSQGWGPASETLEQDAEQFFAAARKANTQGGSAGQLAQRVQRSAFPDRYDQRSGEADRLVGRGPTKRTASGGQAPRLIRGSTTVDTQGAVKAALLDRRKGMSLGKRIIEQVRSGEHTTETPAEVTPGKYPSAPTRKTPSRSSAGGGIRELFWNGPGDVNIKDGKRVGKGFVSGHTDHVHFAADKAKMERAAALAKSMGLHVGGYGKGITSGHVANSNHYQPFGAMDVSGPRMAEFARAVAGW